LNRSALRRGLTRSGARPSGRIGERLQRREPRLQFRQSGAQLLRFRLAGGLVAAAERALAVLQHRSNTALKR